MCLKPMLSSLNENHSSTNLKTTILDGLLNCMEDPAVIERLVGWDEEGADEEPLYRAFILPMLRLQKLSPRVVHLVQAIVRKVSLYEACLLIQKAADEELQHILRR